MDSLQEIKVKFLQSKLSVTELAERTGLTRDHLYYLLSDYSKTVNIEDYCKIMAVLNEATPYNCETVTGATLQLISNIHNQINKLSTQVQKANADGKITEQELVLMTVSAEHLLEKATEAINEFKQKLNKGA